MQIVNYGHQEIFNCAGREFQPKFTSNMVIMVANVSMKDVKPKLLLMFAVKR
jgi:hypothetical protein